jgi:hypothetical protein
MRMEKRKHIRCPPRGEAFAALQSESARVGRIRNIGKGGLAFEYTSIEDSECKGHQVDIFVSGKGFHISHAPCRVIYDMALRRQHPDGTLFPTFISRQCGLQFGELRKADREQLNMFLKTHTTEESLQDAKTE